MALMRRRIGHNGIRDTAVGNPILAHIHRHRGDRGHRLDPFDLDFRKLLDKGQDGIEFAAQILHFVFRDGNPRETRYPANCICVNGHRRRPWAASDSLGLQRPGYSRGPRSRQLSAA